MCKRSTQSFDFVIVLRYSRVIFYDIDVIESNKICSKPMY